ncbi:hypothetical protein [Niallia sp. 03133]|uniref:hypothetical protein n=1 Tax=Niallia sp. 03133 TaxID=3458060 RepID=UPI004043FEC5
MRKVSGIKNLIIYLHSLDFSITEDEINRLIEEKAIPHQKLIRSILIFDLDHIDWWVKEYREKGR